MNTLPRTITARFFATPDASGALRAHWRSVMTSRRRHELAAAHHLLYLSLLGKDWRRAFILTTNPRRLVNGAFAGWALFSAAAAVRYGWNKEWLLAPFGGLVTEEMLAAVQPWLPSLLPSRFQPEQFRAGAVPFDAYCQPIAAGAGDADA